jgi:hypothetical protein
MISTFSVKGLGPTTVGIGRVLIAAAGVATLGIVLYRAPVWLDAWNVGAVAAAIAAAGIVLVLAVGVAVRGKAHSVQRVAIEMTFFACALIAAETVLLLRAPDRWSDDPAVQRLVSYARAARARGITYDARVPMEVVRDLQRKGMNAVPGFTLASLADSGVARAVRERGLVPLSNVANALVVECNEGIGYLQFHSDERGFNNPPGLSAGPVDVAVIGESLALGHCVAPSTSAVARVRARLPRTADFGIAGSRVLSQLAAFREYVEPLRPAVVVWIVNVNFAEPRHERAQPILMSYLSDPSFSQNLRERQDEVDSFMREMMLPLHEQGDRGLRERLDRAASFPLDRVIKLREVRRAIDFGSATRRPPEAPDLSTFELAVDRVTGTVSQWGGRVIVVVAPNYDISLGRPQDVARYEAVLESLEDEPVTVVDGAALFAAEPDYLSLYTLRMDNHPSERGHAVLGEALLAAIDSREAP